MNENRADRCKLQVLSSDAVGELSCPEGLW
jgi:hypothetical protein